MNRLLIGAVIVLALGFTTTVTALKLNLEKNAELEERQKLLTQLNDELLADIRKREKLQLQTQRMLNTLLKQERERAKQLNAIPISPDEKCLSPVLIEAVKQAGEPSR